MLQLGWIQGILFGDGNISSIMFNHKNKLTDDCQRLLDLLLFI